jgi:hypothetical protein
MTCRISALACLLLALPALASCGGSPAATMMPRSAPLISIFEAGQLFSDTVGTLKTLRRLGVDVVRVDVAWSSLAPDAGSRVRPRNFRPRDPAAYPAAAWAPYDAIVRDARRLRIGVDLTLGPPPPLWAATPRAPTGNGSYAAVWRPSAMQFGAFVRAAAKRYSGTYLPPGARAPLPRVSIWSVWNEPNYGPNLAPQAIGHSTVEVAPRLYRGLLDAAWRAFGQTGHGADTILIGELAPRGLALGDQPGNFSGMVPLRFIRALYCVDSALRPLRDAAALARGCPASAASAEFARLHPALFRASGFAIHPYPQALAPTVATTAVPGAIDYADLPQLPKLQSLLDAVQRLYGSQTRFALYSTEYGYKTDPPLPGAVSPETAALYLNWAEWISWRNPRVRSYDQYLLVDPPPGAGDFVTGLEFADGRRKQTFDAYRMPLFLPVTSASSGQPLEIWGCVRPARFARLDTGKIQVVEIQLRRAGARGFRTVGTARVSNPYGYFDVRQRFPASGAVRLRWSYPDGITIFSRIAEITIR